MELLKSKSFYKNIAFIAFLLILFLTPVGTEMRVYIAKIRVVLLNPSLEDEDQQQKLTEIDLSWNIVNSDGQAVSLKSLNNKPVIINYWATWCPPCIAEMPSFQDLYNDYGDKVNFVFLTSDEPKVVDAFLTKRELDLPVYFQTFRAPAKLSTSSLPTTFLIDKNGKILIDEVGASDWNGSKMRSILDKAIAE